MRVLTKYSLITLSLTTLLAAVTTVAGFQKPPVQNQKDLAGKWSLTVTANPDDKRDIVFNERLEGTYLAKDDTRKRISKVTYKGGYFYFTIPDLQLYFQMRKVGNRFEGKVTAYSKTDKTAPEPVRMTKK